MRLEQQLVEVGTPVLWPDDGTAENGIIDNAAFNRYRFAFSGTGAATATVEFKVSATDTFRTLTPPVTWAELETWIAAGVYQLRLTAVGNDFTADIDAFTE